MKVLLLIVNERSEKSGLPKMAAISGVKMLVTSEVTTAVNAAPMTTATARSTTLPRRMNSLNSVTMPFFSVGHARTLPCRCATDESGRTRSGPVAGISG